MSHGTSNLFRLRVLEKGREPQVVPIGRYPFQVGRGSDVDLRLQSPGVWDRHLEFELQPQEGLLVQCQQGALATIGSESVERRRLRNGDEIRIGDLTLQVYLAPVVRRSLAVWEVLFWTVMVIVALAQFLLGYALLTAL
ncbi:MAG: FHA domain-containing protein [Verrucomicrobiales bacterium]|nr:FHA domain-containing protein [Verrucomicrobiales bacterium]